MTRSHAKQAATMLFAGLMLCSAPAHADLAGELDKMGKDLCKSLELKCKTPARSKTPARNPAKAAAAPDGGKTGTAETKPPSVVPIPRPKPAGLVRNPPVTGPAPPPLPRSKPPTPVAALPSAPTQGPAVSIPEYALPGRECLDQLRADHVEFESIATPAGTGLCRVDVAVRLLAVPAPRGPIVLPDRPVLNCRFARQFSLWLSDAGAAIVSARMNSPLAKVSTGPGYECRGRNGDASAKLSEHGFGNAVDITTIATTDGRTIRISDAIVTSSPAYALLRGLRMTACGYFTTVLGPGANAAHASHFHFDMGLHGKSHTYRICQ